MDKTRPLCAATHCLMRNRHKPDCPDNSRCWGCLPRPAADGLHLCWVEIRRIPEDALKVAALHAALERALIRSGGEQGEKTSGSSSGAPVPDGEVVEIRSHMRGTLLATVRLISQERGMAYPQETYAEDLYGAEGPLRVLSRTTEDLRAAAAYIAKHAEWIAGHRYAAAISQDLRGLAGDGRHWALAYPSGSDRMYVGDCPAILTEDDGSETVCGARLYQYAGRPQIACGNCGVEDTIEQWRRWLVADVAHEADAYAVAAHLAMSWMRPVDPQAVKKWAQRGHINPVTAPVEGSDKTRLVRGERNRTLYVLADAVKYATDLWGPPAPVRRAS